MTPSPLRRIPLHFYISRGRPKSSSALPAASQAPDSVPPPCPVGLSSAHVPSQTQPIASQRMPPAGPPASSHLPEVLEASQRHWSPLEAKHQVGRPSGLPPGPGCWLFATLASELRRAAAAEIGTLPPRSPSVLAPSLTFQKQHVLSPAEGEGEKHTCQC